jgi:hypothetical protein
MTKYIRPLMAALLFFAACQAPAQAATWFVAQGGSDGALGTSAGAAWADPSQHGGQVACGDTISVAAGTYATPFAWSFNKDCSGPKAYITLVCPVAGSCVHTVSTDFQAGINLYGNASYWIVDGFDVSTTGANGSGIALQNNDGSATHVQNHFIFRNNVAHDNACAGISAAQIGTNISWDYVTIIGNTTYNNANLSGYQCSGIGIFQPQPLDHDGGFHNFILANVSYHNRACNHNDLASCGIYTTDGNGIIVDSTLTNAAYDGATLVADNLATNNGGRGVHIFSSAHVKAVHNTSYHNLQDTFLCATPYAEIDSTAGRQNEVYNNIAYADSTLPCTAPAAQTATGGSAGTASAYGSGATRGAGKTADVFDWNLAFSAQGSGFAAVATDGSTTAVFGAHQLYGDPLFASLPHPTAATAASILIAAFAPGVGSLARKAAYPLFSLHSTDILGVARAGWKANVDLGAEQVSP